MSDIDENLDATLWGADLIGLAANVVDEKGAVDVRRTYYLLEKGLLPGTKVGRIWTSTRRLARSVTEGAVEQAAERRKKAKADETA
jgi:hypothetical protein